ncbi:MAG TPA: hypothetical protein VIS96_16560 [Terrimicrobiaceae bacterium]
MISHRSSQSFLAVVVLLLLGGRSYGDPILSLTFDDPSGVFAAYPEGMSILALTKTPTIGESVIASGFGGKGQLKLEAGSWVADGSEPPASLQLITDSAMETKAFLRLFNNKATGLRGFAVITPDGTETSLASFSQVENGKVVFNGGLDLFFRFSEENPSQQDLVPHFFSVAGDGTRLIVEAEDGGIAATLSDGKDEVVFDVDLDGAADANRVKTTSLKPAPIGPEASHLAIALQTADTGVVTLKVFFKAGTGPIDTREDTDLVSKAEFSLISTDSAKSLKDGDFAIGAESRSSPERVVLDLAAVRIFKPAPAIFPDISGKE